MEVNETFIRWNAKKSKLERNIIAIEKAWVYLVPTSGCGWMKIETTL